MRHALARLPLRLATGLVLGGCAVPAAEQNDIELPPILLEISGLAAASDHSVFAHNDEHAIVHEIELADGRIKRVFALGDPTIEGDFEGIAVARGMVYLVTSDGLIYEARPGADGERVAYRTYDSGVGQHCEIEGLSNAPDTDHLLMACKRLRRDEDRPRLEIYRWRIGAAQADQEPWLSLELASFLSEEESAGLRPSGLEWDAARGRLLVISARNAMMVVLDREGRVLATHNLDPARHRQTEGIAILPECRMVLADEGSQTRRGRITTYPCPD